jgi:hypothetical protein
MIVVRCGVIQGNPRPPGPFSPFSSPIDCVLCAAWQGFSTTDAKHKSSGSLADHQRPSLGICVAWKVGENVWLDSFIPTATGNADEGTCGRTLTPAYSLVLAISDAVVRQRRCGCATCGGSGKRKEKTGSRTGFPNSVRLTAASVYRREKQAIEQVFSKRCGIRRSCFFCLVVGGSNKRGTTSRRNWWLVVVTSWYKSCSATLLQPWLAHTPIIGSDLFHIPALERPCISSRKFRLNGQN